MAFFARRELEKVKDVMRGFYLHEFVNAFLESDDNVYKVEVNNDFNNLIADEIGSYRPKTFEALENRVRKVCRKNDLGEPAVDGFMASNRLQAIYDHYMSDVPTALYCYEIGMGMSEKFPEYFQRTQLDQWEFCEAILFLYPAKRDRTIEDYLMPRHYREQLTDHFYSQLRDVQHLKIVVNNFAELHPYYRFYPFS